MDIRKLLCSLALAILPAALPLLAHQEGASFSGAIIDPLEVHHAHIEDEQRLNLFFIRGRPDPAGGTRDLFAQSLELAVTFGDDFRSGMEIIIPYLETLDAQDRGLGDIEFQPYKYSFIIRPDEIFTGVLAFRLPTGDESRGLGDGQTLFEPHLFYDRAWGNWYLGLNVALSQALSDRGTTELEHGVVLSYSFIDEPPDKAGIAPTVPAQSLVPAVSIEFVGETGIRGEIRGERDWAVIPGLNLWQPESGWTFRLGARIPVTDDRDSDVTYLVQVGNHLDWSRLLR